ncbi:ThiJ/PfpI [Coprinopsis sp. MPI-PUGE-AT-0042]|nr:ThiJ/PfpI [Coprinopsis sp. MPI-PUGE-AT-0042]
MPSVLIVLSSANETLRGRPTGWYLPEAAHPYYVLAPHAAIDFAAPKGANPPLDPASVKAFAKDEDCTKFLNDPVVQEKLANAKKLSDIDASQYDAIFYVGGHGPVIDLAVDEVNAKLASEFWKAGKIVSAVCHGPAALVGAVDSEGKSIFEGRKFTGFSNNEEQIMGTVEDVPFLLEDKIVGLGGKFEKAAEPWGAHVVVDGKLMTGQNPASGKGLAEEILKTF